MQFRYWIVIAIRHIDILIYDIFLARSPTPNCNATGFNDVALLDPLFEIFLDSNFANVKLKNLGK